MDELAEMGLTLAQMFLSLFVAMPRLPKALVNTNAGGSAREVVSGGAPWCKFPTPVIFKDPELPRNTPKRS